MSTEALTPEEARDLVVDALANVVDDPNHVITADLLRMALSGLRATRQDAAPDPDGCICFVGPSVAAYCPVHHPVRAVTPDPAEPGLDAVYRTFCNTLPTTGTLGRGRTRRRAIGTAEAMIHLRRVIAEARDALRAATPDPAEPVTQHEFTSGGTFELRGTRPGLPYPPHIVYIDRDAEGRRRTTFVAEVYGNALAHARALAAGATERPLDFPDHTHQWTERSQEQLDSEYRETGALIGRWYCPGCYTETDTQPDGALGWAWECVSCDRPVRPMGMCQTCGVFGVMRLAAGATERPLDVAWALAEAALPDGWLFHGVALADHSMEGDAVTEPGGWGPDWVASMTWPGHCEYDDCDHDEAYRVGEGLTPVAALLALAARLSPATATPEAGDA